MVGNEKVLLSSGPLYREIKAHGWVCCRVPKKEYKIGDQVVHINKENVYFQSDVDDSEYQCELAKPICFACLSRCNFFSYSSLKRKNTTVIRRDEILAASCIESDVATSQVLGKEPEDTNAALHVTSKQNNIMYTFQVPNEQIDMVAASIMEQGGDSKMY